MKYIDFENHVDLQTQQNLAKFGKQDIPTLLFACGEELGEIYHEYLKNPHSSKFRIEVIHLAALLPVIYTASISERRQT